MKHLFTIALVFLFVSACQPSPEQVQRAIEKTQVAAAEITAKAATTTPVFTETPSPPSTPKPTSTHVPTDTPTLTPTPTPDIRGIYEDTGKYLCTTDELPKEAKYYLPDSSWMEFRTNDKYKTEKGKNYVKSTKRISSWYVEYRRGTWSVKTPLNVSCTIITFETIDGAQLALTKFNQVEWFPQKPYKYIQDKPGIGDASIAYEIIESDSEVGQVTVYTIQYTFRNLVVDITLAGNGNEISHDFALYVGQIVLDKLKTAPLSLRSQ